MSSQPFRHTAEQVDRVKQSMRQAWNLPGAGYGEMAETLRPAVERLIEAAGIAPGARVLDGATGAGSRRSRRPVVTLSSLASISPRS